MANINKSNRLLSLIQEKMWPKKMFSDALLSSDIPESHQIQMPGQYKECAGVKYLRYDVKARKNSPGNWDLHEEWYCLISRETMARFCAAAGDGWCSLDHLRWDQLQLPKPNPREGAQGWVLGTGRWGSMKNRRGLEKGLAYCNNLALMLVITINTLFDETVSRWERGEENRRSPGATG